MFRLSKKKFFASVVFRVCWFHSRPEPRMCWHKIFRGFLQCLKKNSEMLI